MPVTVKIHIWHLRTRHMQSLPVWGPEASNSFSERKWGQDVSRALLPVQAPGKDPLVACFSACWYLTSLGVWSHQVSFYLHPHTAFCFNLHLFLSSQDRTDGLLGYSGAISFSKPVTQQHLQGSIFRTR